MSETTDLRIGQGGLGMKYVKKLLPAFIAAAMAILLGPAAAFAAPGSGDLAAAGQKIRCDDVKSTYLFAPQAETAEYVELVAEKAVDYPLYFDGETGHLYKTFSYNFSTGVKTFGNRSKSAAQNARKIN